MIIENRKICEIELTPEELGILAEASDILEQIVDFAADEGVKGFKVAYEDHSVDEFSTCMVALSDFCRPCGRLVGYFDEYNE